MKQKLALFLFGLLSWQLLAAHDFVSNGIYYRITSSSSKNVAVTFRGDSYSAYSNEYSGSVTIPSTVTYSGTTYSVTSIGQDAFRDCTSLTYISIPASVTDVYLPFCGCSSLATVYLANSSSNAVTRFYSNTYQYYFDESDDEWHYRITDVPIFGDCPLQNLYIGHNMNCVKYYEGITVYDDCYGYWLGTRSGGALRSDQTINRVEYGSNVTKGSEACFSANSINNLYIPSIEKWCEIYACVDNGYYDSDGDWYSSFTGPISNLMACCNNLYVNNVKTTDIDIPTSVTTLGYATFMNAKCIESVTLPAYLSSIGEKCFYGCTNLKTVINNSALRLTKGSNTDGYVAYYASLVRSAGDIVVDDYLFEYIDNKYYLKAYVGTDTELTLPEKVNGCSYGIGTRAFQGLSTITAITMPSGLTSIGDYAFSNCTGLTQITIPEAVTSIGIYAFYGCTGLTVVDFNAVNCTSMGGNSGYYYSCAAFYGCSNLATINIGENVTQIPGNAFRDCTSLTKVNINDLDAWCKIKFTNNDSNPLTYAHNLYLNGELVTHLVIPGSVTEVNSHAFRGCSSLTQVTIPNSVTSIGDYAFSGCSGLTQVMIPETVTSIGSYAFEVCTGLPRVTIPESVTTIGTEAFRGCIALTQVIIPNSVTTIGTRAFYGCTGMTQVTIGNSLTSIDSQSFYECTGLTQVIIGNSVTSIGTDAFRGCSSLAEVAIPNSVTTIGTGAFFGCTSMTQVAIPNSVTSIDQEAFRGCTGLTQVTIPNSVTSINYSAFYGCTGLTQVTIGSSVSSIRSNAFSGCTGLTVVNFNATNCSYMGESYSRVFSNCPNLATINFGENVTKIPSYAFYYCTGLTQVTIPEAVTLIDSYAFFGCTELKTVINYSSLALTKGDTSHGYVDYYADKIITNPTDIDGYLFVDGKLCAYVGTETALTLPASYQDGSYEIAELAFKGNTHISSVAIPAAVTAMGESVFEGCTGLTQVSNQGAIASLPKNVFRGCSALASVVIPETVTSIGQEAFSGCSALTAVAIPASVTAMGESVFEGCTGLSQVSNQGAMASLPKNAFRGCSALEYVEIPENVISIGQEAFGGCVALANIVSRNASVAPACEANVFDSSIYATCELAVPAAAQLRYYALAPWANFQHIVAIQDIQYSLMLNSEHVSLNVGETFALTAAYEPEKAVSPVVIFTSSNNEVATVDDQGVITAVGEGSATVTATEVSGLTATCEVTVTDPAKPADYLFTVDDTTISPRAATPVAVSLANVSPVTSFQCDIHLPDGLTIDTDEYGSYVFNRSSRLDNTFVVASSDYNGAVRLLVYSSQNHDTSGSEGELFYIPVKLTDASIAAGTEMTLSITEISVTLSADFYEVMLPDVTAVLTIGPSYNPGDVNNDGRISAADVSMAVSYVLGGDPVNAIREAADINNDGRISAADVSILVSYVLAGRTVNAPARLAADGDTGQYAETSALSLDGDMLRIDLGNIGSYTSAQADIQLAPGVGVREVRLAPGNADSHVVAWNVDTDGRLRILAYSPHLRAFADGEPYAEIRLTSAVADDGVAQIGLSEVYMTECDGDTFTERRADDTSLSASLSGIALATAESAATIKINGRVYNAAPDAGGCVTLADTLGRIWRIAPGASISIPAGVYLIGSHKIFIP